MLPPQLSDADGFNDWSFTALTPLPGWALLLFAGVLAGALWMVVASTRSAPRNVKWPLVTLRVLGLLFAFGLLLEPGLQLQQVSSVPGRVAVLMDRSRSMGLPSGNATHEGETRLTRAQQFLRDAQPALAALPESVTLDTAMFGEDVENVPWDGLLKAEPHGDHSNLLKAIQTTLASKPGRPLAGILLLSDGADNVDLPGTALPSEVRERLVAAGVPIHSVALGAEQGLKDLAVAAVQADDIAFVRNPLEIDAVISARGLESMAVPVTLKKDGRVIAVTQAQVGGDRANAQVSFKFEPREVGEAVYSVEVPEQPGEVLRDNNRRFFTLKVIRDRIRVLQVAGQPSWDVRFLRKLLKENPSVDLISFFILRTPTDTMTVRQDELSLIPFPTKELFTEELGTFDVVIFQNFNFAPYEMGAYLNNVRDFVVDKGGGFAMVGGGLSFSEAGYENTVLADLLPVTLPSGRGHYVDEGYTPVLTEAGKRHPILGFPGTDAASLIQKLPPFEGFNSTRGLAPGAEALLTHPAPRMGPPGQPVLAVREVGKGRTLALTTDSLWFWALPDAGTGGRGTAHREVWANAIRWLIGDPALSRVRVEARAGAFDPQEPVMLTVRAFDPGYGPLAGANVDLVMEGVGGVTLDAKAPTQLVTLQGVTGPEGEWTVKIPPPGPGAYRVRATARVRGAALGSDEDAFLVRSADREISEAAPRPELLAALSDVTGGQVVASAGEVAGLQWKLPEGVRVHKRKTLPLWDRWWVAAVFALLWGSEWFLRRRKGYV